jgi:hypothetical protein
MMVTDREKMEALLAGKRLKKKYADKVFVYLELREGTLFERWDANGIVSTPPYQMLNDYEID